MNLMIFFSPRQGRARHLNLAHPLTVSLLSIAALAVLAGVFALGVKAGVQGVGLGSLGRSMAELLKAFGAHTTGVRRSLTGCAGQPEVDRLITFDEMEAELPHADHVVLVLPGGTATDGIFTARHFNAMRPGAYLYNLGRGNCYREGDLLAALANGPLAGAGLDVFAEEPLPATSPLWEKHNVLITPHSSAISQEYIDLFIQEWHGTLREL